MRLSIHGAPLTYKELEKFGKEQNKPKEDSNLPWSKRPTGMLVTCCKCHTRTSQAKKIRKNQYVCPSCC